MRPETGDSTSRVLLGGTPSSGSTLLSLMLDSHSEVFCGPGTGLLSHPGLWDGRASVSAFLPPPPSVKSKAVMGGLTWAEKNSRGLAYHLVPWAEVRTHRHRFDSAIALMAYLGEARCAIESKRVFCECSSTNAYAALRALECDPELKVILTIRNAEDVMRSLARESELPIVSVTRWVAKANLILSAWAQFGPSRVMIVRYEDLVRDPQSESRRICRFLGVQGGDQIDHMVTRQRTLRRGCDPLAQKNIDPATQWRYSPLDVIRPVAEQEEGIPLPYRTMALLNTVRLSGTAMKEFGQETPVRTAASASEELGYKPTWDPTAKLGEPMRIKPANLHYLDFHRQLLVGGAVTPRT